MNIKTKAMNKLIDYYLVKGGKQLIIYFKKSSWKLQKQKTKHS